MFEPNAEDAELFFANALSVSARRRIYEIAYRHTLADLRMHAEPLRSFPTAHGTAPTGFVVNDAKRSILDGQAPRPRDSDATAHLKRVLDDRDELVARGRKQSRAVRPDAWCENSRSRAHRGPTPDHHGAEKHMATFKKPAKKTTKKATKQTSGKGGDRVGPQQQADRPSRSLSESAQQIWLAGVGAFGRAQAEGTKLFEGLVKEGLNLEKTARKFAGGQAEVVRDVVESKVGQARERAVDTWDRLEKVFEERVHQALVKLDVPGRNDLANLSHRVDGLTNELRRQGGRATKPPATTKTAAAAPARKVPVRKAVSKKSAPRVIVKKQAARKATRKASATPKTPAAP